MTRWLGPVIVLAIAAIAGHIFVLQSAPTLIMSRALALMEDRGIPLHGFSLAPRMTPDTQTVVRPSPDLAYSVCRFDFDMAPQGLRVVMAPYGRYSSLGFFADNTDNFSTFRGDGRQIALTIMPPGTDTFELDTITSPSSKGLILIRRLAPTNSAYEEVEEIAKGDRCEAVR